MAQGNVHGGGIVRNRKQVARESAPDVRALFGRLLATNTVSIDACMSLQDNRDMETVLNRESQERTYLVLRPAVSTRRGCG